MEFEVRHITYIYIYPPIFTVLNNTGLQANTSMMKENPTQNFLGILKFANSTMGFFNIYKQLMFCIHL